MPTRADRRPRRPAGTWPHTAHTEALKRRMMLTVVPLGGELHVNTHTTGAQSDSQVAMDADGNFVVAWFGAGPGDTVGIFARRYDVRGVPQGDEFRVNTFTTNSQWQPGVAMDADGNFVVVWTSDYQDGSSQGVYAQRYSAAGVPQGGEFRVNTHTTNYQWEPAVAMDANGNFVVAWTSFAQDGAGDGIYAQRYNAAGLPQGDEFRVNTDTSLYEKRPSVAMDADGDFVVGWLHGSYAMYYSTPYEVRAQRYNVAGVPQSSELQVNTATIDALDLSIAMDSDGDFVIAWSAEDVCARRYSAAGVPRGGEFRVNTYTTDIQNAASIAMDAEGNFIVTWASEEPLPPGIDIFAQRYNAEGVPEGNEFLVNTHTTARQQSPSVAMDAAGDFVVAWSGAGQDDSSGIFAQRYAVVPEVISDSFLFESSPHRLRFRFNHDVRDSLSVEDLVVQNFTTGQTIPSNQFALLYDTASEVATFMYLGQGSDFIGGVLPDGNYRSTLLASGIITPQGASLAEDHEFEFFFLNGDANRDGRIILRDFNILAANFGQSGTDFTRGDFTYDGTTDLEDFNILAGRFGVTLPAASAAPVDPVSGAFGDTSIDEEVDWKTMLLG